MRNFKRFLSEAAKKIPWDSDPTIGWWEDQDPVVVYHGTNQANKESFIKNGINVKDPDTGMISLALEPNTARGLCIYVWWRI